MFEKEYFKIITSCLLSTCYCLRDFRFVLSQHITVDSDVMIQQSDQELELNENVAYGPIRSIISV